MLTSDDPPLPEFKEALAALAPAVCEACEWPYEFASEITVNGAAIKDYGDHFGAVLSASRKLPESGLVHNFNTPLRKTARGERGDQHWSEEAEERIANLADAARNYVNGQRSQQDLFEKGEESDDVETEPELIEA